MVHVTEVTGIKMVLTTRLLQCLKYVFLQKNSPMVPSVLHYTDHMTQDIFNAKCEQGLIILRLTPGCSPRRETLPLLVHCLKTLAQCVCLLPLNEDHHCEQQAISKMSTTHECLEVSSLLC